MRFFRKNVGTTDQVIRFLIGAGFISMYFVAETQAMKWTGLAIGTVVLLTVVFSFCPVYKLFGLNTRDMKGKGGGGTSTAKVSSFEDKAEAEKARKAAIKAEEEKKKEKDEHKTAA